MRRNRLQQSEKNSPSVETQDGKENDDDSILSPEELMTSCSETRQSWLHDAESASDLLDIEKRYRLISRITKEAMDCTLASSRKDKSEEKQQEFDPWALSTTTSSSSATAAATASNKNTKKEQEEEEEIWSRYNCVLNECRQRLVLLYLQRGNLEDARLLLQRLGCVARLSSSILRYDCSLPSFSKSEPAVGGKNASPVCFVDNIVSPSTLSRLQAVFGTSAASSNHSVGDDYWTHHNYSTDPPSPYFSYAFQLPLSTQVSPEADQSIIGELVRTVQSATSLMFPEVAEAHFVEMWAHSRCHSSGHQLHTDSYDEGRGGSAHNSPITTSVFVVEAGCGGPTLVTTQKIGDTKLAQKGYLCYPKENRVVLFDSNYIHGVIPGSGEALASKKTEESVGKRRRVTLMLAFWRKGFKINHEKGQGSARPFPFCSSSSSSSSSSSLSNLSWVKALNSASLSSSSAFQSEQLRAPPPLSHVWEKVSDDQPWPAKNPIPSYEACYQGF